MKGTYKIITTDRPEWSSYKQFNNQSEADTYTNSVGPNYTATFYMSYTPIDIDTKLDLDLTFGKHLIREFVRDNRVAQITAQEEALMMVKFGTILNYATVGAIRKISELLPSESIDTVFTQGRKDKYTQMIADYLNSI